MKKQTIILLAAVCAVFAGCGPKNPSGADAAALRTIISDETTVVSTQQGRLQGFLDGDVYTFLGIPYAKVERFMPPQPVKNGRA